MAAVSNRKFTREEVLNQDIFNTNSGKQPVRLPKRCQGRTWWLGSSKRPAKRSNFVDVCAEQISGILDAFCSSGSIDTATMLTTPVNPAPILQKEARVCWRLFEGE